MYTHCCNHVLNLVIGASSQLPVIRNAMATTSDICVFLLRSAQRVSVFQDKCWEVSGSVSSRQKLKPICATHWLERHDSIFIFVTLLLAVVSTLEEMQLENKQVEVATKAATLLIAALVMQHTSGIFLPVSKPLQRKELVIFAVIELIDSVLNILRQNRSNCENVFHKIFDQAKNGCEKYDAPLLIPRRCESQIFRDYYPSDDPENFFREAIFIPNLDHLIVEMEDRFLDQKHKCQSLCGLIPKYCDASPNTAQDLERLLHICQEDIGPRAAVVPEVQRWLNKWQKEDVSTVPSSPIKALCACLADNHPNVYILLTILGTLPVSTATNERSFSTMRRLKTYLRSSIGNKRITGLALLSIPKDRQIDREENYERLCCQQ